MTKDLRTVTAHSVRRAAELAMAAGDLPNVEWSLRRGLLLFPDAEDLWRALLSFLSEHDPARLGASVAEMFADLSRGGNRPELEPATSRLLARLGQEPQRSSSTYPVPQHQVKLVPGPGRGVR